MMILKCQNDRNNSSSPYLDTWVKSEYIIEGKLGKKNKEQSVVKITYKC